MECAQTSHLSDEGFFKQFHGKTIQQRIPLFGGIDLTWRCNLRCVHCYLGGFSTVGRPGMRELDTAQWQRVMDEITDAGCLYFLITGGEPLLRKDFGQLYRHARSNGLVVTVFSNGTLITEDILDLFQDLPPHCIEISLYGATADTYEKITGVRGSHGRCLEGIEKLLQRRLNVRLKTILMRLNRHEIHDMERMAGEFGVRFRFDAAIFPRFDGDRSPVGLRVTPEEAVAVEMSNPARLREWRGLMERLNNDPVSDSLYVCGAGVTNFHIDACGMLKPCIMVRDLAYPLADGAFARGWQEVMPRLRKRKTAPGYLCNRCEQKALCDLCPPFFALEDGQEECYSEFLCEMARARFGQLSAVEKESG
jgi:MoaA/NifB/PqqE/SkfB family radical SAM enzyme